jgi:hypothetical protein
MNPSVGSGDVPYSVVTTFRFDVLSGYARILHATNGTADDGFYSFDDAGSIYGAVNEAYDGTAVFTTGSNATVALTSQPSAGTNFYVNGTRILNLNETFPVTNDTLRFFKDDAVSSKTTPLRTRLEGCPAYGCTAGFSAMLRSPGSGRTGPAALSATPNRQHRPRRSARKRRSARRRVTQRPAVQKAVGLLAPAPVRS